MRRNRIMVWVAAALGIVCWIIWANTAPVVSEYVICSEKIHENFSGFRIAQISDLHNDLFGKGNGKLLEQLRTIRPDIIVITGDLVDSYDTQISVAVDFAEEAGQIAPVYYVTGNHESRLSQYPQMCSQLQDVGVEVLEDRQIHLERGGAFLTVLGLNDPGFRQNEKDCGVILREMMQSASGFTGLLTHRPELLDMYAENGPDLVLAGHAHGGQFRLPLLGGVYAPNQGFFPKYDSGQYISGETAMIVSRGLGNSSFPFRINNRPEIVVVELKSSEND